MSTAALAKSSLTVLLAQGLQSLRGVLLLPFITRLLSVGDYGLWVQGGTLVSLLSPIVTLYLSSAILRFFAAEGNPRAVAKTLHGAVLTVAVLGLSVTAAMLPASGAVAGAFFEGERLIVCLAIASLLPECLGSMFLAYFRTFRQMGKFSFFSVARPYVELMVAIALLLTGHGLADLMIAMAVVRGALTGVMGVIVLLQTGWATPDFSALPEFLRFSVPLIPMNLMLWITNASDRFVIGYYLGTAAVGLYNPGYALGSVVAFLSAPIMYVLPPFVYAHYDRGRIELAMKYLSSTILLVVCVGLLMTAMLGGLSMPILSLLATSEIARQGHLVTPLVALGVTAQVCTIVLSIALSCAKKTHWMALSASLAAILNLALNLTFIPRFGIVAAAATTLVAMLVDFSIRLRMAQRHVHLALEWSRLLRAGVAAAALGLGLFAVSPTTLVPLTALGLSSPLLYILMLLGLKVATTSDLARGWDFAVGLLRKTAH